MKLEAMTRQWDQIRGNLGRGRPWFELCRLPASLIVAVDPLAGALLVGATWRQVPSAICLMLGAFCLHAGAAALNDWHDYKTDRIENPGRPIPAGRLGRWYALFGAVVLMSVGLTFTSVPGFESGQMGVAILAAILLYEFIMKGAPVGRAIPALARMLALLMGMMLVPVTEAGAAGWPLRVVCLLILGAYAIGGAILAQRPPDALRRTIATSGAIVVGVAIATLGLLRFFFPGQALYASAGVWVGLLLAVAGYPIILAIARPGEPTLRAAAWGTLLGSVVLDAAFVAFTRGVWISLPVAGFLAIAYQARRQLDGTSQDLAADSATPEDLDAMPVPSVPPVVPVAPVGNVADLLDVNGPQPAAPGVPDSAPDEPRA